MRPLQWEEWELWERLLQAHHYLGFHALMGESLRYVAEWEGRWVALLAWSSAALKCGVRDRWIGWAGVLQFQRLHLIANSSRFLMLAGGVRDLASRVLGLNVRRLSGDWQRVYGHPVPESLVVAFVVKVLAKLSEARRNDGSPKKITRSRHPDFRERMKRSK